MSFQIVPIAEASIQTLVKSISDAVINPLIIFIFSLALVYFLVGLVKYLLNPDNEEIRKSNKQHMLWGIIGMFIMISVFGIMNVLLNTLGEKDIKVNSDGTYSIDKNISN